MFLTGYFKSSSLPFRTRGGVKVPHEKSTALEKTVVMPAPKQVVITTLQHIGAPCVPVVKTGDSVKVGDIIADSDKFISAPIHSSVSGTISKISKIIMPDGAKVDAIYIESDGLGELSTKIKPPKLETKENLIKIARESGLVGLGGAGFPTHVKLNVSDDKKIDTLIINAAECEPYITSDNRAAIEDTSDVISGIITVKKMLKIDTAIIAVEDNKPHAIKMLQDAINTQKENINLVKLKSRYPQGAEKVLIKAASNRVVPIGKLPLDIGCIVMNIASIAFLSKYIRNGIPLIEKRITIAGSAIKKPQNVTALIGTPISEIIKFCGGYKTEPKKILMGGPMMGIALLDDTFPILKNTNAILALDENDAILPETQDCIRCGKCIESCPMGLMPTLIESNVNSKDLKELQKLDTMNCMECGCCSFICPSGRPLVQAIRLGKKLLKDNNISKP
ncbi:MAG: H+/Na+-translocating ferredoxin:NAD+ oxidoreductase subunit C [Eubacteriales bacterium SKADARSKE-1]|nr:H+/Na+-translocating ferredoxin:NAD+ oxidoreductase subunit C [Eubacteriales bacterium SKADARSKE-1]